MKKYVLIISKTYPKTHPKARQYTDFLMKIDFETKIHTIRANYPLWEKRFKKIKNGEAYLNIRSWSGKPYHSNQIERYQLHNIDGISIQKLELKQDGFYIDDRKSDITIDDLSYRDGLLKQDFIDWFKGKLKPGMEPMAIIHFTHFRYE